MRVKAVFEQNPHSGYTSKNMAKGKQNLIDILEQNYRDIEGIEDNCIYIDIENMEKGVNSTLNIYSHNICGLSSKLDELKIIMNWQKRKVNQN